MAAQLGGAAVGAAAAIFKEITGIIDVTQEQELEKIRQRFNQFNPSSIVTPEVLADLAVRGIRERGVLDTLAERNAMNADQFGLLVDQRVPWLDVAAVNDAWLRHLITDEERDLFYARQGWTGRNADLLRQLAFQQPNVSDVVTFLTRDVFLPFIVQEYGMDLEYPPDADEYFHRIGITPETARLFWLAHWQLPSVEQGREMFQRSYIDEAQFRRLLRAQGVEPFWRDPLTQVLYNPLTRVDLRRMDRLAIINEAELRRGYLDIGYSPVNADRLVRFTKALNSTDKKKTLTDLTDGLKSRIVSGVIGGQLKEDEANAYLIDLGYAQEEIAAFFVDERMIRNDKHRERLTDLIGALYIDDKRTEQETRTYLAEHAFSEDEIAFRMQEWQLERELKATTPQEQKQREVSVAIVLTAFAEKIATESETASHLKALRYSDANVALLIAEEKYKLAVAEQKDAIEIVHQRFVAGRISESEARSDLGKANLNAVRVDALIAKWNAEHHQKVEELPLGTVKELFQRSLWDATRTSANLQHRGINNDDVNALLGLWGDQEKERELRQQAAAEKAAARAAKASQTT